MSGIPSPNFSLVPAQENHPTFSIEKPLIAAPKATRHITFHEIVPARMEEENVQGLTDALFKSAQELNLMKENEFAELQANFQRVLQNRPVVHLTNDEETFLYRRPGVPDKLYKHYLALDMDVSVPREDVFPKQNDEANLTVSSTAKTFYKTTKELKKLLAICQVKNLVNELYLEIIHHLNCYLHYLPSTNKSPGRLELSPLNLTESIGQYSSRFNRAISDRRELFEQKVVFSITKLVPKVNTVSLLIINSPGFLTPWILIGKLLDCQYRKFKLVIVNPRCNEKVEQIKLRNLTQFMQSLRDVKFKLEVFKNIHWLFHHKAHAVIGFPPFKTLSNSCENGNTTEYVNRNKEWGQIVKASSYIAKDGKVFWMGEKYTYSIDPSNNQVRYQGLTVQNNAILESINELNANDYENYAFISLIGEVVDEAFMLTAALKEKGFDYLDITICQPDNKKNTVALETYKGLLQSTGIMTTFHVVEKPENWFKGKHAFDFVVLEDKKNFSKNLDMATNNDGLLYRVAGRKITCEQIKKHKEEAPHDKANA
jgi:hypothetical protein